LVDYNNDVRSVVEKLKSRQAELERKLLMQPNSAPTTAQSINDKADDVINKVENVQKDDINRVRGMNVLAVETEKIGEHVVDELVRQSEVLGVVESDLYIIRHDVKTSRQLLKAIQKELQKDKCIRLGCFLFLSILLILVILGATGTFKKSGKKAGGDSQPSATDRCQGCASGTTGAIVPVA